MSDTRHDLVLALVLLVSIGCQPGLNNQPRIGKPDSASAFFADGQSNRPVEPGTIARGHVADESARQTGKSNDQYLREIPLPLTEAFLLRGQERFNINCAQCHDRTGSGNGKVVSRGLIRPPSYQTDGSRGLKLRGQTVKLTDAPAGYIFDVISNGYGAMASHGDIVAVDDRWAIIAYIRALQLTTTEALMVGEALRSYLWAYCCVAAIPLGSLALLCLQHLTGGAWGVILRRPMEAAVRTLPLVAMMFLPIGLWSEELYPWASGDYAAPYPKGLYLNLKWFRIRAAIYFAIWIGLGVLLNQWSREQDRANSPRLERRFRLLAGPGLGLYGLSITFAAIDWVMSLEPQWFSSIFGVLFGVGQILSAFVFAILVVLKLTGKPPYRAVLVAGHLRDLGSLMLAFVMIWAYLGVSQLILIWSANLKEEVPYYLARSQHGWQYVAVAVVLSQFVLPFLMLLTRDGKRNPQLLGAVAAIILATRCLDLYWQIAPGWPIHSRTVFWTDLIALPVLAGPWFVYFKWQLQRRPLLPLHVGASAAEDHHG